MTLSIAALKTDRHWRSATGLDQKRFDKLLTLVEQSYEQIYGKSIQQRQTDCPQEPALSTYTDLLLFTLFSFKSGLSFDLLGFATGMDGSSAKRNQDIGLRVLEHALTESGHAPKRSFRSPEEFKQFFQKKGTILIDATEQRTQRPGERDYQEEMYSGKKKPTPLKR